MSTTPTNFHESNRASEVLAKIGSGSADADFARAIHQAIDRSQETMKESTVTVVVKIKPDDQLGCLRIRAEVTAKLPKLPAPASQMHVGPNGQLLTQMEWMMGGNGPSEHKPLQIEQAAAANTASGRFKIVAPPAAAPVAAAPTPKPVVGKDAAAGEKANA